MIMKKKRRINIDRLVALCSLILLSLLAIILLICMVIYVQNISKEETPVHKTVMVYDDGIPFETVIETPPELREPQLIGTFKLTGYCRCEKCCGEWADGWTATMTVATAGRTIAVDPNIIPLGSHVIINGHEYIAEDTGSAINENRIDIFCENHIDCFSADCNGYAEVYLMER